MKICTVEMNVQTMEWGPQVIGLLHLVLYIIGAAFPGHYNYMSIYLVYLLYVQE